MRAEIFPGLGQAKSQLYFDLQAMIAKNGGRLHLANLLECEMVKSMLYYFKPKYQKTREPYLPWKQEEIDFIIANRHSTHLSLSRTMNRSIRAIQYMSAKLVRAGIVESNHNKNY